MIAQPFQPHPALKQYVIHYLWIEGEAEHIEPILGFVPPCNMEGLRFYFDSLPASSLTNFEKPMSRYDVTAQLTEPIQVRFNGYFKAVLVFMPRVRLARLLGLSLHHCIDYELSLEDLFPRQIRIFNEQVQTSDSKTHIINCIDNLLLSILDKHEVKPNRIDYCVDQIYRHRGNLKVSDLADSLTCSRRTLELKFREQLGHTPKAYIDIARINFVLNRIKYLQEYRNRELIENTGFYDDAHMINNFTRWIDKTPQQLFEQLPDNHWMLQSEFEERLLNQ